MKNCIVVIPIYKNIPTREECASVRQTFRILGHHDIVLVTHAGCRLDAYREIIEAEQDTLRTEFFDKGYFDSTEHYSDLCFSEEFYMRFKEYEYMLICQTDAWVFRDELDYWCRQGYDYIGAPVYFPYNKRRFTRIFYGVGNGGFCLRRITHCLRIIHADRHRIFLRPGILAKIYWYSFLYNEDYGQSRLRRLRLLPLFVAKALGFRNSIVQFRKTGCEEDAILSFWAHNAWGLSCHIPGETEAARFSFEVHPEYLFHKTGNRLPFGCHAFGKWDYETFWKQYIDYGR